MKCNKKIYLILILPLIIMISGCVQKQKKSEVCIKNICYNVEIANTPEKRATGLMNRESIPANSGMLFIFEDESIQEFWMKNTLIPLDIIWIDTNSKIVDIKQAEPCTKDPCAIYTPSKEARYALEINQSQASRNNIEIGDSVTLKNIKTTNEQ